MGLNLAAAVIGLIAAGYGLSGRSSWAALLAPAGWLVFLAGLVRLLVPDFF